MLVVLSLLTCSLVSFVATTSSGNEPVKVNVRVEGDISTLYDEDIHTQGHVVNPLSGDNHTCDGTNHNAHPDPVPVATAALDNASLSGNFKWNGVWCPDIDDYLVNQIAGVPESITPSNDSWSLYLNYTLANVGGCQLQVNEDDEVLWAFGPFGQTAMHLDGPKEVTVNSFNKFHVTDGSNGNPITDASVNGGMTGENGDVQLKFPDIGVKNLKAEKNGTVRSNTLQVKVIQGLVVKDTEKQIALEELFKG